MTCVDRTAPTFSASMALVPQDPVIFAAWRENIRSGALMPVMRKSSRRSCCRV
jgi:hypothetical protein